MKEITVEQLHNLPPNSYELIDIRDDGLVEYPPKRMDTKKLIAELKKENPYVESNIFNSMENVNLDTVIAYKKKGVRYSFLDEY